VLQKGRIELQELVPTLEEMHTSLLSLSRGFRDRRWLYGGVEGGGLVGDG
jgi:hypothetical protein